MRKFLVSAAIAASAIGLAAPAAAQWAPPPPPGYGYGYHHNYGQVRRLDARIDALQRRIRHLDRRDILSEREAARLYQQSRELEHRLHFAARNGLSGWEAQDIERRIYRLEARIHREARDFNSWRGEGRHDGWSDRDRDGRNDRYERYGRDHDRDRDHDDDDDD